MERWHPCSTYVIREAEHCYCYADAHAIWSFHSRFNKVSIYIIHYLAIKGRNWKTLQGFHYTFITTARLCEATSPYVHSHVCIVCFESVLVWFSLLICSYRGEKCVCAGSYGVYLSRQYRVPALQTLPMHSDPDPDPGIHSTVLIRRSLRNM